MESGIVTITEKACSLVLQDILNNTGHKDVNVFRGINNVDKEAPALICWAENATEDFPFSGIFHMRTHIVIKAMAKDTSINNFDKLTGDVHAGFLVDNIEALLTSSIPDQYFVYQIVFDNNSSVEEGDAWVNDLSFDCVSSTKTG